MFRWQTVIDTSIAALVALSVCERATSEFVQVICTSDHVSCASCDLHCRWLGLGFDVHGLPPLFQKYEAFTVLPDQNFVRESKRIGTIPAGAFILCENEECELKGGPLKLIAAVIAMVSLAQAGRTWSTLPSKNLFSTWPAWSMCSCLRISLVDDQWVC